MPVFLYGKKKQISLVARLVLLYLLAPLLLFVLMGAGSYSIIRSILNNKMEVSIRSDLNYTAESLQALTMELQNISTQLAYGQAGVNLNGIRQEINPYNKSTMITNLKNEVNTIAFTNSRILYLGYYLEGSGEILYDSGETLGADITRLPPLLMEQGEYSFYGPHASLLKYTREDVISIRRRLPGSEEDTFVYAEGMLDVKLENLFLQESRLLFFNEEDELVWSNLEEELNRLVDPADFTGDDSGRWQNYLWQRVKDSGGYSVAILISRAEYSRYDQEFIGRLMLSIVIFACLFLTTLVMIRRMIISPLSKFKSEIAYMQQGDLTREISRTNIPEYDEVLNEFSIMKVRLREQMVENELAQKKEAKLKLEKLLYQINPHFLMNTLNTLHWMAVKKKVPELDGLIMALNKLLYYNLKMDDHRVTVADELNAIRQYCSLQQARFDFTYRIEICQEEVLNKKIPRFILQPLVENSIYHGVNEGGDILIRTWWDHGIVIEVVDDGEGMSQEDLDALLDERKERQKSYEMGIGLSYVIQILKDRYQERARIEIKSSMGKGTQVLIRIEEKRGH